MSVCKSCGANIWWAKTLAGTAMPLDAEPSPEGTVIVVLGISRVLGKGEVTDHTRYVPHFITCPNAASHRRKA